MVSLLLLVLFLPFSSFLALFYFGKQANRWVGLYTSLTTFIGLILSLILTKSVFDSPQTFTFEWFVINNHTFTLSLQLDSLVSMMLLLVHLVALLVQIFSISYMRHDEGRWRYFAFLSLFVFSMLIIIASGSLLLMYVGWELVGLCSYLLIGFWYQNPRAVWAAKKAFLLNRIGDAGFLIGILLLFVIFGTTDFLKLAAATSHNPQLTTISLLLFCGAMGKSAQFPLSAWLPDAMEGPTPVSALIHAATMVAAGIFLLARIHFLLTPDALIVITIIGTITMVLGAYRAVFQNDIKKLLAFSTISQLGLMVVGMGVGAREASLFHLLTHAFFKAGLFLCAGTVIHVVHSQDMRQMGGLRRALPVTFMAYTICAAALAGLPFFSGFLSKDAILVQAFAWASVRGGLAFLIPLAGVCSAGLTAFYMTKQWKMVFLGKATDSHQEDYLFKIPMIVLAVFSTFVWFSWNPFDAAQSWFFVLFSTTFAHHLHTIVAILTTVVVGLGIIAGLRITVAESRFSTFLDCIYDVYFTTFIRVVSQKITYFDRRILDTTINGFGYLTVILAHIMGRFDRIVIDGVVNSLAWLSGFFGNRTRRLQNGQVQSYFLLMLVGILFLLFWVLT